MGAYSGNSGISGVSGVGGLLRKLRKFFLEFLALGVYSGNSGSFFLEFLELGAYSGSSGISGAPRAGGDTVPLPMHHRLPEFRELVVMVIFS